MFNVSCNQSIILDYYTYIGLCEIKNPNLFCNNIIYLPYNLPSINYCIIPPIDNILTALFLTLGIYWLVLLIKMLKNNLH